MLKYNINKISLGLLILLLLGLAYSLFLVKPEIIASPDLKASEPAVQELDIQENFASFFVDSKALIPGEDKVGPFIKDPVSTPIEIDRSERQASYDGFALSESKKSTIETLQAASAAENADAVVVSVTSGLEANVDSLERVAVARGSEFLEFDTAKMDQTLQPIVLIEGDQLIVDEINEGLRRYQEKTDAPLNAKPIKPSVFAPEESIEGGQQYNQAMAKLISINTKLRAADEENATLQAQFHLVANHNKKLAQIIRDINDQIRSYTLTN